MAVKYRCTKCDRKFVEFGVAKVKAGKACEDCHGEYLQQIGYDATQAAPRKKPALKRKRVRVAAEEEVAPTLAGFDQDEGVMPDINTLATGGSAAIDDTDEFETTDAAEVEVEADAEGAEDEEAEAVTLEEDVPAEEVDVAIKPGVEEEEEEEDDD